jgi:hypothetical protein
MFDDMPIFRQFVGEGFLAGTNQGNVPPPRRGAPQRGWYSWLPKEKACGSIQADSPKCFLKGTPKA